MSKVVAFKSEDVYVLSTDERGYMEYLLYVSGHDSVNEELHTVLHSLLKEAEGAVYEEEIKQKVHEKPYFTITGSSA